MSARIYRDARPSLVGARVLPMTAEDASFWKLLAVRADNKRQQTRKTAGEKGGV